MYNLPFYMFALILVLFHKYETSLMENAQGHQNRNNVRCREVFDSWASPLLKKVYEHSASY